jgi:hypothetical protein
MNKKLTLAVLLWVASCCTLCAQAQSNDLNKEVAKPDPKIYSDVHVVFMHLEDRSTFDAGIGSRVGYDFSRSISVEGEVNFFPGNKIGHGGKKEQGFLQVKVGRRFDRVGFFAKAGPGLMMQSKGYVTILQSPLGCNGDPGSFSCEDFKTTTSFASDLGGVFEIYPSRRTFIRIDAGSTFLADTVYHKNFQTSSGFGVRF